MSALSNLPPYSEQYAFRAQKSFGVSTGSPSYELIGDFDKPEVPAKTYVYSNDGRWFAYAIPGSVKIFTASDAKLYKELSIEAAVELNFSPLGTFLSTWERVVKLEDGAQHKNLRLWSLETGEEVTSFTQKSQEGWDLQYTSTESHAVRLVGGDIQVFDPSDWSKGVTDKLKVEGVTSITLSPGKNPSIAVFVGERKGAPASIKIHSLATLAGPPTCQKTFYKADSVTIKWNALGTQVLILTQADVDKTNKSYYGETGLILLSAAGNFDCRVTLDKEGPIHDFVWNPNSKEFGVIYGYMPSRAVLFDQRVKVTADFGTHPWNTILFNPQGRLVLLAGFGNLAGKIDVFDRRTLNKVTEISAPNTSWCEWSGDGKTLLTATLSPRLRVDNGIKIWHCSGRLLHVQAVDELYQASWKRTLPERAPPFPANIPIAPAPAASVQANEAIAKPTPTKPAGAYRPPGARGLATPSIFKREDEGGISHSPSGSLPPSRTSTPQQNGNRQPGPGVRGRSVPGAPPPTNQNQQNGAPNTNGGERGEGNKRTRTRTKKKGGDGTNGDREDDGRPTNIEVPPPSAVIEPEPNVPETPAAEGLDPVAKKVRNLSKKLKAIEELKERVNRGDKLEATQLKKIDGEAEIRNELKALGAPA